jgi:hypothetical protein
MNGVFLDALAELKDPSGPETTDEELATQAGDLLGAATDRAGDIDFLAVSFALWRDGHAQVMNADVRRVAAARLIGLGLDDLASHYLLSEDAYDPVIRLARAQRALAVGDSASALAQAEGLDMFGSDWIEAEALSASGEHDEAADAFARLGDTIRSEAESLRARDWEQAGPPPTREAAQLLGDAELLRSNLSALLGRHQP